MRGRPSRRIASLLLLLPPVWLALGCAGIDGDDDDPDPPQGACGTYPAIFNAFPSGWPATVGTDTTLEVATWNLEFFAERRQVKIAKTIDIMTTLKIDLYGVEEISDTTDFNQLVAGLPGHSGRLSPDRYFDGSYQKTGFLWDSSFITASNIHVPAEFDSNSYHFPDDYLVQDSNSQGDVVPGNDPFPRPPLEGTFRAVKNGRTYEFNAIVMHLKAGKNNADDQLRRREATYIIENYLAKQAAQNPTRKYILLGDWNDALNDQPMALNSFRALLEEPDDYTFLTTPMVTRGDLSSHPIGLVDHVMVNRAACGDFSTGRVTTMRLDLVYPGYSSDVSDHRPVVALFKAF